MKVSSGLSVNLAYTYKLFFWVDACTMSINCSSNSKVWSRAALNCLMWGAPTNKDEIEEKKLADNCDTSHRCVNYKLSTS